MATHVIRKLCELEVDAPAATASIKSEPKLWSFGCGAMVGVCSPFASMGIFRRKSVNRVLTVFMRCALIPPL